MITVVRGVKRRVRQTEEMEEDVNMKTRVVLARVRVVGAWGKTENYIYVLRYEMDSEV